MIRVLLLSVLVVAACEPEAHRASVVGDAALPGGAFGGGAFGRVGVLGAQVQNQARLLFDYAPGLSTTPTHVLPPCGAASLAAAALPAGICAIQCTAHSSGAAWQCVDGNGAAFTVTAGTGAAVANAWGGLSQQIFSDANAPTITDANVTALKGILAAPHTIIWTGYGLSSSIVGFPYTLTDGTNFDYMRNEASQTKCDWTNTAKAPNFVEALDNSGVVIDHGYSMVTCRKAGTGASSVYTARINGNSTSTAAWPNDPAVLGTTTLYFGRFSVTTHQINGEQESFTIYTTALTDAQLAAREGAWRGTLTTTSASTDLLTFNGHNTWAQTADGQYMPMGDQVSRVTSAGFYVEEGNASAGSGSNFAVDNLDASSWTAIGTPTTTTNTASGPFSRWKNTAEADLIVDDDAGNFEGYKGTKTLTTYTGHVTMSCFAKTGTTGTTTTKMRLGILTDATGSATCDKTVTGSFARYSCSTLVSGVPTFTQGEVLVGNAAADTGSIIVSQCQIDPDGWAQTPHITNSGIGVDDLSSTANEVLTYPHNAGSQEIIFTPDFTWANDEHLIENEYTYETLDIFHTGRDDHRVLMWQYNYAAHVPAIALRSRDGDVNNMDTYADSDPNMVAGHNYAFKVAWQGVGTDKANRWIYFNECPGSIDTCSATTLIGSDVTGTKFRPTDDVWGGMQIGCRFNRILCFKGHVQRARVWSAP